VWYCLDGCGCGSLLWAGDDDGGDDGEELVDPIQRLGDGNARVGQC